MEAKAGDLQVTRWTLTILITPLATKKRWQEEGQVVNPTGA